MWNRTILTNVIVTGESLFDTLQAYIQLDSGTTWAKKSPAFAGLFARRVSYLLGGCNIGSLLAFGALRDFERHFLTFFESLEAVHLDCGEVSEQILTTVIRSNKAEAF